MTKEIDFSSKHDILIRNLDGTLSPMDYPFYQAKYIGEGIWQILSDGDYIYLIEGNEEALVIDTGYAVGNIRKFCQGLTEKPVWRVANSHEDFDHTANNYQFDKVYMSAKARERASIPFTHAEDFKGMTFPRDYDCEIIGEGFTFDLGQRVIETFELPDHAPGSLVYLDRKGRTLFGGDELVSRFKIINRSVKNFAEQMEKMAAYRSEFDRICAGNMICEAYYIERYLENAKYILAGNQGKPMEAWPEPGYTEDPNQDLDAMIFDRQLPRRTKRQRMRKRDPAHMRVMEYADCKIIYDERKVFEE